MLTPDGAKVIDFGIAALTGAPEPDDHGEILGTPSYVAPERLLGGDVSAATDVYALGVLTTGCSPRAALAQGQRRRNIRAHLVVQPSPLRPSTAYRHRSPTSPCAMP